MRKHVVEQPSRNPILQAKCSCSNLVGIEQRKFSGGVESTKDLRFASRLRGALSNLRLEYGDEAVLLVPIQQAWRASMLSALKALPDAEFIAWRLIASRGGVRVAGANNIEVRVENLLADFSDTK